MIIHTKDLLPTHIDTKGGKKKLLVLEKGDIADILPIKLRILHLLSRKVLTTTQLTEALEAKSRTTRKFLSELEIEGKVRRRKGRSINNSFRLADSWRIISKNKNIAVKPSKKQVCVWYSTKHIDHYTNHYCFLPKEISLTDYFIAAIGVFEGEGSKTKVTTLEVTNNEPLVVYCLLDFFERFYLSKKAWGWRITFNTKLKDKLKERDIQKAREFWIKNSKIHAKNEGGSSPQFLGTKSGKLRPGPPWGTLGISYNSVILRSVLTSIMQNLKPIIIRDKKLVIGYLRGYLAAEAYVGVNDREIQIASTRIEELDYLKKCFDVIGVGASISKATTTAPPRLIITAFDSFMKLYKVDVFKLHPYKKMSFLFKLLNYKILKNDDRKIITRELVVLKKKVKNREKPFKSTYTKTYLARVGN